MTRAGAVRLSFLIVLSGVLLALSPRSLCALAWQPEPSLRDIRRSIREQGAQWTAESTSVSSIPWEDFRRRLGLRVPAGYAHASRVRLSPTGQELPQRWDWREHEGTTPVKDQGQCGSCWAFAATAVLEAAALRHDRYVYDLAEQELISCNTYGYGCNGGWLDGCLDVFRDLGAVAEECMPYEARDGVPCTAASCTVQARASALLYLADDIGTIKTAILEYGAVATGMEVVSDFRYYGGGCYEHPSGGISNHAVALIGWDDTMCGGVWIVKNSWGTDWGEHGYFYIKYRNANIGSENAVFVHVPPRFVAVDAVPVLTRTDEFAPIDLVARVRSGTPAGLVVDSLLVSYRVNGGPWIRQRLLPAGEMDLYQARIPPLRMPSSVEYYFSAADQDGHHGFAPLGAPDSTWSFDLAREWWDFEGPVDGWRVGDAGDDAVSGIWECVEPVGTEAQPGANHTPGGRRCWITGQQEEGNEEIGANDVDGGKTTLLSPAFDLAGSGTAIVKYWRWYSNDKGTSPREDAWIVQARNQGGAWTDLENTRESSDRWVPITRDLIAILGPDVGKVEFRFIASDEGFPSCVEAALDDFAILAEPRQACSAGASLPPVPFEADANGGEVLVRLELPRSAAALVRIFDCGGRMVREFRTGTLGKGSQEVRWDTRDARGRLMRSGTYFWTAEAGRLRRTGSVTLVR
jgi:hypothetical protein